MRQPAEIQMIRARSLAARTKPGRGEGRGSRDSKRRGSRGLRRPTATGRDQTRPDTTHDLRLRRPRRREIRQTKEVLAMARWQCAWCRRLKADNGWPIGPVQALDITISHGVCLECLRRVSTPRRRNLCRSLRPSRRRVRGHRQVRRSSPASVGWITLVRLARVWPRSRQVLATVDQQAERRTRRRRTR